MKKDTIQNAPDIECSASCATCERCALGNYEGARTEMNDHSAQLYATEAEHYFFYFAKEEDKKAV